MQNWKSKLIDSYRILSTPWRYLNKRRLMKAGQLPVYSLFYHRVADKSPNPWTMSEKEFQMQVDWLDKNFDLVSLTEAQQRISSGFNNRPTVAITFDDGYAENFDFALPMLIERRIPFCYFVSLDFLINQTPFPHDIDLNEPLPVNTIESIQALHAAGVEIGAHTRNHVDLGKLSDPQQIVDEVINASNELSEMLESPIRYFAFPFGQRDNLSPVVFQLLKKSGFQGACSAYGGWNTVGGDAFHIQRIHGDPCFERVRNWLSHDPRIGRIGPYDYRVDSTGADLLRTAQGLANCNSDASASQQADNQFFPPLSIHQPKPVDNPIADH